MQTNEQHLNDNLTESDAKAIFDAAFGDAFKDSGSSPPDLLATALDLAHRGWAIFPLQGVVAGTCTCSSGSTCGGKAGKHPRTENGKDDATIDAEQIRRWWERQPDSNVGIRVGGQSGIVVIDIDPRNGGDVSLGRLVKQHGALPVTPTAQTGGGGLHFFFKDPGTKLAGKLAKGIDVKQNGHVVGHGSMHASGNRYVWKAGSSPNEVAVAELPDWMVKILTTATPNATVTGAVGEISQGERNDGLFKLGCALVKRAMSTEAVEAALLAENRVCCKPPLDDREVMSIVASAEKYRGIHSDAPMNTPDLKTTLGIRDRAILEMLYSTGIRRRELVGVSAYDVDHMRGTLMIRYGKGQRDRVVPIGERALAWIDKFLRDARQQLVVEPDPGWLFLTATGGQLPPDWLTGMVRGYLKSAGVPKKGSCHLFRHSMATAMLEGGADVRFIQAMLGHASLRSTEIYTRVSIQKLKEVHSATHPGAKLNTRKFKTDVDDDVTADDVLDALAKEAEDDSEA